MNVRKLSNNEILSGYDEVCRFYPYIPPMTIWRAFEFAVYKHYNLLEPVLDIGCGDGQFFSHVWPKITKVTGVDADSSITKIAEQSGVYQQVYTSKAHLLSVPPNSFKSAFANCALEHMDHLSDVLDAIHYSLYPRGHFLFSVVTDKLIKRSILPQIISKCGDVERAKKIQTDYERYHHLINPLSPDKWIRFLNDSGFEVLEHWPIVPGVISKAFLFVDQLWHIPIDDGEIGVLISSYLQKLIDFPAQFRKILEAILNMETDRAVCSGAVFWATKI